MLRRDALQLGGEIIVLHALMRWARGGAKDEEEGEAGEDSSRDGESTNEDQETLFADSTLYPDLVRCRLGRVY